MAGIIVVSRVGCVASTGGTVDSISSSSSRKVAKCPYQLSAGLHAARSQSSLYP